MPLIQAPPAWRTRSFWRRVPRSHPPPCERQVYKGTTPGRITHSERRVSRLLRRMMVYASTRVCKGPLANPIPHGNDGMRIPSGVP